MLEQQPYYYESGYFLRSYEHRNILYVNTLWLWFNSLIIIFCGDKENNESWKLFINYYELLLNFELLQGNMVVAETPYEFDH